MECIGKTNIRTKHRDILYIFKCPICGKNINKIKREGIIQKSCGEHHVKWNRIKEKRLYNIWRRMKQRCYDKNCDDYRWYGNKGIAVDDYFLDYYNFENWALNNGYKNDLTIDRINSNLNYSTENCRWVTRLDNLKNKDNIIIKDNDKYEIKKLRQNGEKLKSIAKKYGVSLSRISQICK